MNDVHRRSTDASTVTLLLRCKHSGHAVGSSDSDAVTMTLRVLLLTQPQTTADTAVDLTSVTGADDLPDSHINYHPYSQR